LLEILVFFVAIKKGEEKLKEEKILDYYFVTIVNC